MAFAFCPNCGAKLQEGHKFCPNCGASISQFSQPGQTGQPRQTGQPGQPGQSGTSSQPGQPMPNVNKNIPGGAGNTGNGGSDYFYANPGYMSPEKKPKKKKKILLAVIIVGVILLLLLIFAIIGGSDSDDYDEPEPSDVNTTIEDPNAGLDTDIGTGTESTDGSETDSATYGYDGNDSYTSSGSQQPVEQGSGALAASVIAQIESSPNYSEVSYFPPLAVTDDFNGDGIQDLLAVYHIIDDGHNNLPSVAYSLWTLGSEPKMIQSSTIYAEVGGNSGAVGIVKSNGQTYMAFENHSPEDMTYHDISIFNPWPSNESQPTGQGVYLEGSGTYDDEKSGTYFIGQNSATMKEYNAKMDEFSNWVYKLDLLDGAYGDIKTFDNFK